MLSQDVIAFSYIKCSKILCSSLYTGALGRVIYVNVSQLQATWSEWDASPFSGTI